MKRTLIRITSFFILFASISMLSACSWWSSDEDALQPLPPLSPQFSVKELWSRSVNSGSGSSQLQLTSAVAYGKIFSGDYKGHVVANNATTGERIWRTTLDSGVEAGLAAGDGVVFVITNAPEIVALDQKTGKQIWQYSLPDQALAAPVYSQHYVLVKTISGQVIALNSKTGKKCWVYTNKEPSFILRNGSSAAVSGNQVFVGFADGKLLSLELNSGQLVWQKTIAEPDGTTPLERLVDITTTPIVSDDVVYVATYQGKVAAVSAITGEILWSHKISTYKGIALAGNTLFVVDTDSNVWAFNTDTGMVDWKQTKLQQRGVTAPAIIGSTVVVADSQGFLHWLSQGDGHFMVRTVVSQSDTPITNKPVVVNKILYVISGDGKLSAYRQS